MKKTILVILLILAGANLSFAQQRVTGRVTSKDDGQPVAFATVAVKGFTAATATNDNGEYTINVPDGGTTLIVSFMGMIDQEVNIGGRSIVNVVLESEGGVMLAETVVTAMGIKKEKKALGYAVQDIKADELMKNKNLNVINSLSGKIAGVNVTQAGGSAGAGSTIQIRGGTSLERDNQPLFVVDGIIYDNSTPIGGNSGFDGATRTSSTNSNRVMDVNPEDIESMSVLKGPAASALYGSRAAAGVVIITTKKGQEGTTAVNFSSKMSVNWVNRYPEQQGTYKRGFYEVNGTFNDYSTQSWGTPFASGEKMYNNIEDFFETAVSYDNNVSVAGGNKNGSFYLSASRFDQTGIVPNTGYDRTTIRFNGDQKYGILTVGSNVSYSIANTDKTLTSAGLYGSGGGGAMQSVYRWSRSDDMKHYLNSDGTKYRMFEGRQEMADDVENPYWIVNKDKLWDKTNRFTGAVTIGLKVTDWFDITYRAGYDNYTTRNYTLKAPGGAVRLTYQNGKLSDSDYTYEYLTSNLMLNFNKKFGDFDLGLLLGQTAEDTKTRTERRNGWDFVIPGFYSYDNINDSNKQFQSVSSRKRLMGIYGEARIGYKNMAYLSVTGRNDWSSTLPIDNRSYFYPSITGSFIFTEVMPKNSILSFGKVRASWAEVGKDTDPYVTSTTLWPSLNFLPGLGVGNEWQRGNPYLKPERTRSWEVGADLRFFNGRLGIDYAFYSNDSFDQIVVPRLSQATGYILLSTNVGRILNKGMELSITGTPIRTDKFSWDIAVNLSGNRGKVKDLLTGQEVLYVTDVQIGTAKSASFNDTEKNGDYAGLFMGISGSTFRRDPNGNLIVNADNGFPVVNTDQNTPVGDREPTFTGGINNTLRYKDLSLSFLFDVRVGGYIYNGTDYFMTYNGTSKKSEDRQSITVTGVLETKNSDGSFTYTPQAVTYEAGKMYSIKGIQTSGESLIRTYYQSHYTAETKNFMTDTNWLRLRSLTLSYDFTNLINKRQNIVKSLSASVSGHNLFLITNYKGMDPETSAAGSGVIGSSSVGMDYCSVPATAGISFGINVGF